jgi:hypothetical protein
VIVKHSFLLEPGQWTLKGLWCETNRTSFSVEGTVTISWNQPNWFCWHQQLKFPNNEPIPSSSELSEPSELILIYQGYLALRQNQYTFVLKHNLLGNLEGNGSINPTWIIQRYWVLNDRKRRQGFETLYQESKARYRLCSCLTHGHQIISTLEATLVRSPT